MAFGLLLAARGLSASQLGVVVALGLAGNAAGTALVALHGEQLGRRRVLLIASALSAAGLALVALATRPGTLALAAFIGLVNGMGRDRGPAQTVDQSLIADELEGSSHTTAFTRYTFVQDILGAVGSLAAGAPDMLSRHWGLPSLAAYRATFLVMAAVSLVPLILYARVPERAAPAVGAAQLRPESRRRVGGLVGLFALDSVGGGLLAGSILSYWFFRRYGLGGETLGPMFFAARGLNAASYFVAAALARRLGLIRTMVFTHLPSSVILLVLPGIAAPWLAIALFLLRESLVQMDVPARQAYVAAVTQPGERTFALGAPLVAGAGLKIVYDLALYASYRHVRPPDERFSSSRPAG